MIDFLGDAGLILTAEQGAFALLICFGGGILYAILAPRQLYKRLEKMEKKLSDRLEQKKPQE